MQTFGKTERLSSKALIDSLIENGKSFTVQPFRVTWTKVENSGSPLQVLLTVPKRLHKKAVDRNLLKRRMKEAYRKHKTLLKDLTGLGHFSVMIVYTSANKMEYKEIEEKITEALQRLIKQINPDK